MSNAADSGIHVSVGRGDPLAGAGHTAGFTAAAEADEMKRETSANMSR